MTINKELHWQERLKERFPQLEVEDVLSQGASLESMRMKAMDEISAEQPEWTFITARIYLEELYNSVKEQRGLAKPYTQFYELIEVLVDKGIYEKDLLNRYTKEEINELGEHLNQEKDELFTYIGLKTLADRYLARLYDRTLMELPQERFMVIAMSLMKKEVNSQRLSLVKEAYWALSNLYMTVATPTFANAGKAVGQLSSCFIDTVDDSLRGIFDSCTDAATVSKSGGGLGIYLGKIRAKGSSIKNYQNVSSGVLPWMKQLNNVAVSVDQLGQRQGAIAVYLDIWHKDIFSFLDAKLNNGDERQRTHDLFTAVSLPDLFMEAVEARDNWYLFDPHEIRQKMGFSLEDSYDEQKGSGTFRERYEACVNNPDLSRTEVPAIEIMKRIMISQLETGSPFMYYRDEANRMNPNKHEGMVYGSNLCTEIIQNMSPTTVVEEKTEDGKILITKQPGDYVVCNLSSLSLARVVEDDVLERLIPIQVRMLDNVIDVNRIEVKQAEQTNQKYRAIGLGTYGWHHLLAKKGIAWESEEAIRYADELYETINYLTIQASMKLAEEKGAYPMFGGSDWETGEYFERRQYTTDKWTELAEQVKEKGLRNGYLLAVAPNATTALIGGTTASIDPIFQKTYVEEKKNYRIPVTAPDLSPETTWYYKSAYHIDQTWSIRQNGARQRHVDQSISFNLYVSNTIRAKELLELHLLAWKEGLKTTYYLRSTSMEIEDCESCAS
ncbi:ribonucleoside-diphosphate reductase subunit alpha [Halalkalibacterium halodurans]|nr:ribonucleoside-diphosphate reductase subunit alpha [Halalkalibacterium halodurans]MDY7220999.1 ribonucleoside-diphosphate reductase subunit alpha [Halalkalibacterium halodurans]MDY7240238.1 ribonucleoside-diphosphate reductase subunit alpha [Halalkalibacterium halodurans]MED4079889.1 ribonucleoside-diphosphate reductase subunit alpha [Halalkalibacterium halodurans]MED4085292.1 ribonucleoside-diphosphate reductase subunit alpha [Halalkalibacterium halodurans]MED4103825.1 ribonucleoside-dipho